jgi:hypothetical protein
MPSVADVLMHAPVSLCLDCLSVSTGLRAEVLFEEIDKLAPALRAREAACDHCRVPGPVFEDAAAIEGRTARE